jgi:hypothetical protein
MIISIFINERSLQGQFENPHHFTKSIVEMNKLFESINAFKHSSKLYKSLELEYKFEAMKTQNFVTSFAKVDRQLQQIFIQNMRERLKIKDWQTEQLHSDNDEFTINETELVTGETLAEAAERQLQTHNCLILNFLQSDFLEKIEVCKNKTQKTVLAAVANRTEWSAFLQEKRLVRTMNKNNKHGENGKGAHKTNKGDTVSFLYSSVEEAQNLLNTAQKSQVHASRLYNFDTKNQKFIVFYYEGDTPQNQYHAFHLDNENDVPKDILLHFKPT